MFGLPSARIVTKYLSGLIAWNLGLHRVSSVIHRLDRVDNWFGQNGWVTRTAWRVSCEIKVGSLATKLLSLLHWWLKLGWHLRLCLGMQWESGLRLLYAAVDIKGSNHVLVSLHGSLIVSETAGWAYYAIVQNWALVIELWSLWVPSMRGGSLLIVWLHGLRQLHRIFIIYCDLRWFLWLVGMFGQRFGWLRLGNWLVHYLGLKHYVGLSLLKAILI